MTPDVETSAPSGEAAEVCRRSAPGTDETAEIEIGDLMSQNTRSIHPQQPGVPLGEYDVRQPLPYPLHVNLNGDVLRQDYWQGEPTALIGFQLDESVQTVDLLTSAWFNGEPDSAVGMFPVFMGRDGNFYTDLRPVAKVS